MMKFRDVLNYFKKSKDATIIDDNNFVAIGTEKMYKELLSRGLKPAHDGVKKQGLINKRFRIQDGIIYADTPEETLKKIAQARKDREKEANR